MMSILVNKGIPVSYTDTLNQTVLYYVARENQVKCIDMLISLGKYFGYNKRM